MTQTEYEQKRCECLKEFCQRYRIEEANENIIDTFNWIFDLAYALGKQERGTEGTVINGWMCRDKDGSLALFYGSSKPSKEDGDDYWSAVFGSTLEYLNQNMFPDVTWNDLEPTKVEIIIKRKNNG